MHESAPEKVPNMQLHTLHMANRCMSSWRIPASSSNVPANKGGTSGSCLYRATDDGCVVHSIGRQLGICMGRLHSSTECGELEADVVHAKGAPV